MRYWTGGGREGERVAGIDIPYSCTSITLLFSVKSDFNVYQTPLKCRGLNLFEPQFCPSRENTDETSNIFLKINRTGADYIE